MPHFAFETNAAPLSQEEKRWIARLEKCLLDCPDRFSLSTIGGPDLEVIDQKEMDALGIEVEEQTANRAGCVVARVRSKPQIHGLCG